MTDVYPIKRIKLHNFKRFRDISIECNPGLNILIGDNESGKSSILAAINLVLSGSRTKVESAGLERLFNAHVVSQFLNGSRKLEAIPNMFIELYLTEQDNFSLNGKNNSENVQCDGLRLECSLNMELSKEVHELLSFPECVFPFEYYNIRFHTFSGEPYTGHRRFFRHVLIDNSVIGSEYAIREYVGKMYGVIATAVEKNKHQNEYRKQKQQFTDSILADINSRLPDYQFSLKHDKKTNLETDLTIREGAIQIEDKGMGKQCFIKTQFALSRQKETAEIILLEEPENHLSHLKMKSLIASINESDNSQLFISTHSNMIASRLDLRKANLLHPETTHHVQLNKLPAETAQFFIKAPDHNILDFILSKKAILVEGAAEYILFEALYQKVTGERLNNSEVLILSVNGTSFKRYLDIACMLQIKTAIVRDNDGDYEHNCVKHYENYLADHIAIFSDKDSRRSTFEVCIYEDNKKICDELFASNRTSLSVQDYMLKNKTESAYKLLSEKGNELVVPQYIQEAILWIRE